MSRLKYHTISLLLFFQCGFLINSVYAQYDQVWMFGQGAGLDFGNGDPQAIKSSMDGFGEGSASICDKNGHLLFYTEGTIVWDKNGNIMSGGEDLVPFRSNNPYTTTSSTCQGTIIIPQFGKEHRYYVFSLTSYEQQQNAGRLYYSVVDMSLNNGLGGVDANEKGIFLDSGLKEQMTSVVGEQCNVWLMVRSTENVFKAFSISRSGLNKVPQLSKVDVGLSGKKFSGQMVISPDKRKLVTAHISFDWTVGGPGSIELFDFDAATGMVNYKATIESTIGAYGAAFSPDNTKLYAASNLGVLYQYDLTAAVPTSSRIVIGKIQYLTHLKLAPNGKIYGNSIWQSSDSVNWSTLFAIDFPNLSGSACRFVTNAIQMLPGSLMRLGFPNVINYVAETDAKPVVTHTESPCWFNAGGYTLEAKGKSWDYRWDDNSTGKIRTINAPGRYWVTYHTSPCTQHTDSFVFSTPYGVLPQVGLEASCPNSGNGKAWAYSYPGDTVKYRYVWRNKKNDILSTTDTLDQAAAGSYSLQVSTMSCDTTFWLELPELKDKVSFSVDSLFCVGDTIWLHNKSESYYQDFYWLANGELFSTAAQPYSVAERRGAFTLQLIGQGSVCLDTAYALIRIDTTLNTRFLPSDDSICLGHLVTFQVPQMDSSIVSLSWLIGDMHFSNQRDAFLEHAFDHSGLQPVTLHTEYRACPAYDFSGEVFVEALPLIDLGTDRKLCLNGGTLVLSNKYPLNSVRYLWNTGDTSSMLRVKQPGHYYLTAYTRGLGCSSTESAEVRKNCYMDLPNSFTPDGDGNNDFFFPRINLSEGISAFHMEIFNRWGQMVFETNSVEGRGWDGRLNGQQQPMGVYIYRIETGFNQLTEAYTGNVTLLR